MIAFLFFIVVSTTCAHARLAKWLDSSTSRTFRLSGRKTKQTKHEKPNVKKSHFRNLQIKYILFLLWFGFTFSFYFYFSSISVFDFWFHSEMRLDWINMSAIIIMNCAYCRRSLWIRIRCLWRKRVLAYVVRFFFFFAFRTMQNVRYYALNKLENDRLQPFAEPLDVHSLRKSISQRRKRRRRNEIGEPIFARRII